MQHLITRGGYLDRLRNLPIENPTPEDMATICPHLTLEQAVAAFTTKEHSNYVACPPIKIKGAFQIVSLSEEWVEEVKVHRQGDPNVVEGKKTHPPALRYAFACRTPASYANGKSHEDAFTEYAHMEEAIAYAEENWGDELILDDWIDYVRMYVQDPSDLDECESPKTKAVVHLTTYRGWNTIINDHGKPESVVINDAIAVMTLDPFEAYEVKGGRGGYTEFNCAYCGGGLGLNHCHSCGQQFRDDYFRCGWYTPIPQKIVELLEESGHIFQMDPMIARRREREWWSKG